MSEDAADTVATVTPALRYRDGAAAVDWLCRAFGFERRLVVPGGGVAHAQLAFGRGMVMLGSAREDEYDSLLAQPGAVGGKVTQASYIVVTDADAHYCRARAAGAEIVIDIKDQPHGGRAYTCRDPEGNIWNFGTYDPWERG